MKLLDAMNKEWYFVVVHIFSQ